MSLEAAMEGSAKPQAALDETFSCSSLDTFIVHFGLSSIQTTLADFDVTTLNDLVEILSKDSVMTSLEGVISPDDYEALLHAISKTNIVHKISEKPIPYALRSGNKKKSGKRKKSRDDEEDEDAGIRDMRKKKVGIRALHAQLKKAASLDLVIMLDCTGSMGNYLQDIQSHITSLVTAVGKLHPDSSMRLAFVGYHHVSNHIDNKKQYIQRFTNNVNMFRTVLQGLYTSGGGYDCLADIAGGLKIVSELEWQSTTRILFHIGDMPCHGSEYHTPRLSDNFPSGDPNGIVIEQILEKLYQSHVEYYFGRLTSHTDRMIDVFNDHFERFAASAAAASCSNGQLYNDVNEDEGGVYGAFGLNLSDNNKDEDDHDEKEVMKEEKDSSSSSSSGCSENLNANRDSDSDSITGDYDEDEDEDAFEGGFLEINEDDDNYVKAIDIQDPSLLLSTITSKVTESMTTSLSTDFSTHTAVGDLLSQFGSLNLCLNRKASKWKELSAEPAQLLEIPLPECMEELMLDPAALDEVRQVTFVPIASEMLSSTGYQQERGHTRARMCSDCRTKDTSSECQVKLEDAPFARGSCRNAYKARLTPVLLPPAHNPPSISLVTPFRSRLGTENNEISNSDSDSDDRSNNTAPACHSISAEFTDKVSKTVIGIVKLPLPSLSHRNTSKDMCAGSWGDLDAYHHALKMQHAYAVARYLATTFNSRIQAMYIPGRDGQPPPIVMYTPISLLHLPKRGGQQRYATVEHDITLPHTAASLTVMQTHSFVEAAQCAQASKRLLHAHNASSTSSATITSHTKKSTTPQCQEESCAHPQAVKLKFEKYNGNHGLCVPIPSPSGTDHSVVQAFSHWSYEESRHDLLVVDCQGVFQPPDEELVGRSGGTFLLTDPAVHADDVMKFGGTNLGTEGIRRFFKTHHCNLYCAALGLATYSL